jgi:hypothetical protein
MTYRPIRASASAIRTAWLDQSLTVQQAAASVGYVSRKAFQLRAKALGLPPRKTGQMTLIGGPLFAAMWAAGVMSSDIAAHFGVKRTSPSQAARKAGLARRPLGPLPGAISISEFWQMRAAERWAQTAGIEQAALINAEMADQIGNCIVGYQTKRAA